MPQAGQSKLEQEISEELCENPAGIMEKYICTAGIEKDKVGE